MLVFRRIRPVLMLCLICSVRHLRHDCGEFYKQDRSIHAQKEADVPHSSAHTRNYCKSVSYTGEVQEQILFHTRKLYNLARSEEHTSELQSRFDLVCRLLLEKKK